MTRVLVTGSRSWPHPEQVRQALSELAEPNSLLTVVHGACPIGADAVADQWARSNAFVNERHPANWRPNGTFDRAAGFKRNAEMVALGADICLAFIHNHSAGATHTADLAEKAGIPVRRFTAGPEAHPTTKGGH